MSADYSTEDLKGYNHGDYVSICIFLDLPMSPWGRREEHLVDINQEILDQLNDIWKQHTDGK